MKAFMSTDFASAAGEAMADKFDAEVATMGNMVAESEILGLVPEASRDRVRGLLGALERRNVRYGRDTRAV